MNVLFCIPIRDAIDGLRNYLEITGSILPRCYDPLISLCLSDIRLNSRPELVPSATAVVTRTSLLIALNFVRHLAVEKIIGWTGSTLLFLDRFNP